MIWYHFCRRNSSYFKSYTRKLLQSLAYYWK